jgi:hypothetical protein
VGKEETVGEGRRQGFPQLKLGVNEKGGGAGFLGIVVKSARGWWETMAVAVF